MSEQDNYSISSTIGIKNAWFKLGFVLIVKYFHISISVNLRYDFHRMEGKKVHFAY